MKQVQISIPKPCHEDWNTMLPEEKGRFCLSCQKTVIDFSAMSDAEILRHIANSSKSICGNFASDQLDRSIVELPQRKKNVFRYAWNMVAAFLIFSTKTTAQVKPVKDNIVCTPGTKPEEVNVPMIRGKLIASNRIITGRVTDTFGNPIAFASVYLKNGRTGQSCDTAGYFKITVYNPLHDTLVISALGFTHKEIPLTNERKADALVIQLQQQERMFLGETVVVVRHKKKKPFLNLFKKKETPVCVKPAVEPKLIIFPNPASVQQEVKIQLRDLTSGEWQMNLYNSTGALVLSNPVTVSSKDQTTSIPSFYTKMAGLYVIELTNASLNKKVTGKLLVQ